MISRYCARPNLHIAVVIIMPCFWSIPYLVMNRFHTCDLHSGSQTWSHSRWGFYQAITLDFIFMGPSDDIVFHLRTHTNTFYPTFLFHFLTHTMENPLRRKRWNSIFWLLLWAAQKCSHKVKDNNRDTHLYNKRNTLILLKFFGLSLYLKQDNVLRKWKALSTPNVIAFLMVLGCYIWLWCSYNW